MKPKTKSERFVLAKKEQWEKLHHIVLLLSKKGYTSLSPEDILAFPLIYRLTCADLAEAKMLQLSFFTALFCFLAFPERKSY